MSLLSLIKSPQNLPIFRNLQLLRPHHGLGLHYEIHYSSIKIEENFRYPLRQI